MRFCVAVCLLAFCDVTPGSKNTFGVYPKAAGQNTGDNGEKYSETLVGKSKNVEKVVRGNVDGRNIFLVHCRTFSNNK